MTIITLPNGNRITAGAYVKTWAAIKRDPHATYTSLNLTNEHGTVILARFRKEMHERINQRAA